MEKNEHCIFNDIPVVKKSGTFHSAVLTSFSIDLLHFDNFLLHLLRRKKICSINIFADLDQVSEAMEWVSPAFLGNAGKKYSITSIDSNGAFHPKINFFVGDDAVMVIIGSGNLTVAGHGKNHEAFTGFMIDKNDETQRPLIEECWHYIKSVAYRGTNFDKQRILHEIPENCSLLTNNSKIQPHHVYRVKDGLDAALLYNDETSGILMQLTRIVPLQDVQEITIVSPFYDEQGSTLIRLSQLCPNAKMSVLIQRDCQIPPLKMKKHERIFFYDFDETSRGKKKFTTYHRLLHAKIFHFKTADKEYCLIGSANATIPAMGTESNRGVNDEMCVLYISENYHFLSSLGIKHAKGKITIPRKNIIKKEQGKTASRLKYKILTAQYYNGCLSLNCNNIGSNDNIYIAVEDGHKTEYLRITDINQEQLIAEHCLIKNVTICYIVDDTHSCISNKVFIHMTNDLEATNPSKESRSINSIISQIENDGYNGLEIAEILGDLLIGMVDQDGITPNKVKSSSNNGKEKDESLPNFHYNPDLDNNQTSKNRSGGNDRSSRLIECIEDSIRRKIKEIDSSIEEQMNEEEEGNAESSYNRETHRSYTGTIKTTKDVKSIAQITSSALHKYIKLVEKRLLQQKHTGNRHITIDDLNYFSIFIFAALEICILNREKYVFEGIDSIERSSLKKKLYDRLDDCIYDEGTKAFMKFVYFCGISKISESTHVEAIAQRALKYAILYGTLLFRKATEYYKQTSGKQIMSGIRSLFRIFGIPSMKYLEAELGPLSERYNYEFRIRHVEMFINMVINQ